MGEVCVYIYMLEREKERCWEKAERSNRSPDLFLWARDVYIYVGERERERERQTERHWKWERSNTSPDLLMGEVCGCMGV